MSGVDAKGTAAWNKSVTRAEMLQFMYNINGLAGTGQFKYPKERPAKKVNRENRKNTGYFLA